MESINLHLHKATDAEDSFAVSVEGDAPGLWRAERGYGAAFQKVWTVELQSQSLPDLHQVDWEPVLVRLIEAYDLNDPLIVGFEWPLRAAA